MILALRDLTYSKEKEGWSERDDSEIEISVEGDGVGGQSLEVDQHDGACLGERRHRNEPHHLPLGTCTACLSLRVLLLLL